MKKLKFSERDIDNLKSICKLNEASLKKLMERFIASNYKNFIIDKDFIIALGDIPIALAAHLDTVFKYQPKDIYYDPKATVMWSPEGLGADDRAGVYSIIKIINAGYRPTVILTTQEEVGGLGSYALIEKYPQMIKRLKFILQLDRQGKKDCVFYDCNNNLFKKMIRSFGFSEEMGSFSDISILCPEWDVAGVNLSVGYFNEHNYIETLNFTYMFQTINKVINILESEKNLEYYNYGDSFCDYCNKKIPQTDLYDLIKNGEKIPSHICVDCLKDYMLNNPKKRLCFCDNCYCFYENDDSYICPNCEERSDIFDF